MNGKPVKIMKYEGLIIVDGKETAFNDISNLKADEIASMEIYKADSKVAKSYGEKGKNESSKSRVILKDCVFQNIIYK